MLAQNKAEFIRQLIERERRREQEEKLLGMFNEAAAHLVKDDLEERESLLGSFAAGSADLLPWKRRPQQKA